MEEQDMNEILSVVQDQQDQTPLDLVMITKEAEARIDAIKQIKSLALRVTNTADWVDQQGKPYLVSSGAEKVARLFGIWWGNMKYTKEEGEDTKGKFYIYSCMGNFSLKNQTIEAIGTCSSRDPFFGKANGEWKPIYEVDEPNIKKSAYSNCIVNGITRLLGIRNLTWEEIQKGAGIDQSKVSKVEYGKGAKGGNTSTKDEKELQDDLWTMLMNMESGSPDMAAKHLEQLTEFKSRDGKMVSGVKSIKALKGKRLEVTYGKAKKEHDEWFKGMEDGGNL